MKSRINNQHLTFEIGNWKFDIPRLSGTGFTLIELLIVIAILGILGVAVLVGINPVDKIRSANDAKVIHDIGTIAGATESYAATHDGIYPDSITELVTSGELKTEPIPPSGYNPPSNKYNFVQVPNPCSATITCENAIIWMNLKSLKYKNNPKHVYDSETGKTCDVADSTDPACP